MSSKSSPFASFAESAESAKMEARYHAVSGQLTVGELLAVLQRIVRKDPEARNLPVFHVEMGGLTPSTIVEDDEEKVVIAGGY